MKKTLFVSALVGIAAVALAAANSGLGVGDKVTPFHPNHVSGPLKNTDSCFPCTFQNRPQVQVWVNGDDMDNVSAIAKMLDAKMRANDEFKALVVVVTKDAASAKRTLAKTASMPGLGTIGMAYIAPDNGAIKAYKINLDNEIKNTVLVYKNWEVASKFVNLKADDKGLKELGQAVGKITAN